MRAAGNVDKADILKGLDGRSKGCGVVLYQKLHKVVRAIRELQNSMLHGRNRIVSRVVVAVAVEVTSREDEEGVTTLDTTMAVTIAVFTKAGAAVAARKNTTNSSSIRINSTVLGTCPALPSWTDVSSTLAIFRGRRDGRNSRISSFSVVMWIGQRL